MPNATETPFQFHVPFACGQVDAQNNVIRGVSLMTGNLEAEGHDLQVDDTTLAQIFEWAKKKGKITVKMDHKGSDGKTFTTIIGYLTNFAWKSGDLKVRGDLELLESDPYTPKVLEMAQRMPGNFGLSAAFKGKGVKGAGGKNFARCTKLLSVDLVEAPAANPDGLFSVPVDSGKKSIMADSLTPETNEAVPAWAQQILDNQKALSERQEAFEKEVAAQLQQADEPGLDELGNMTDEALDAAGYDVAKVRAAVEDAIASGELTQEGQAPAEASPNAAPAAAAAAAPAATAASLSAKVTEIVQFEIGKVRRQARAEAEQAEAEQAFAVIEEKVTALAAKNDELTTELATIKAENKTLKFAVRTGKVNPVAPGVEVGVNFAAKDAPEGTFDHAVVTKFNALVKAGMKEKDAKVAAYEFGIKNHPDLYTEFRDNGSKPIQFAAQ